MPYYLFNSLQRLWQQDLFKKGRKGASFTMAIVCFALTTTVFSTVLFVIGSVLQFATPVSNAW